MANEKIEIDIVLNDGSIAKGFAKINAEAKKTESLLSGAFKVFSGVQLSNAVDKLAGGLKGLFDDAIKEAIQGEDAVNQLASAMQSAGTYTGAAVESFQNLANRLQDTTKFSDDAVISAGALARNFTRTNEQAEKLTEAAVQLSAATGRDLNTSIEQLGGTLTGTAGRLGKVVPELNGLTEASLKSGAAIDVVFKRFSGTAENQLNTFGGALANAKNQFNSFLEGIGNEIINNPTVIAALKGFGDFFKNILGDINKGAGGTKSIIDGIVVAGVDGFVLLAKSVAFLADNIDTVKLSFVSLLNLFYRAKVSLAEIDVAAYGLTSKIPGITKDNYNRATDALKKANEQLKENEKLGISVAENQLNNEGRFDFLIARADKLRESVVSATNQISNVTTSLKDQSGRVTPEIIDQKALLDARMKIEGFRDSAFDLIDEVYRGIAGLKTIDLSTTFEDLGLSAQLVAATTASEIAGITERIRGFKNNTLEIAKQIGDAVKNGLTNAIVGGINAFVTAIVNGENAFKNFGKAVLGIIGDLAQQIGGFIIAAGIAKHELFSGDPYQTIAAGVALVAIGSALKAISSKGQSGGFAGAAGSSTTPPLTPATPVSGVGDGIADTQSKVQVIVQGNIFDSDATGLRIATILKEQGFANAVRT